MALMAATTTAQDRFSWVMEMQKMTRALLSNLEPSRRF